MSDLIFGSSGLVGRALHRAADKAFGIPHDMVDINDYTSMLQVFETHRPKIVYLAAANSNVDACEDKRTDAVNVGGTIMCLRLCEMFDAKLVWFSSSYVFNGLSRVPYNEQHPTDPVQHYGVQKETVERHILHSGHKALIVRTVGVFGSEQGNKNFVKQVATSVSANKKVFAPADQYMNPIYAVDLAELTIKLAQKYYGIWHVAGDDVVSKYDFAREIARFFGKERMVEAVTSDKIKQKAARPSMGALDCTEMCQHLKVGSPGLLARLNTFLDGEYAT